MRGLMVALGLFAAAASPAAAVPMFNDRMAEIYEVERFELRDDILFVLFLPTADAKREAALMCKNDMLNLRMVHPVSRANLRKEKGDLYEAAGWDMWAASVCWKIRGEDGPPPKAQD